jgi:CheY-like chemotaxis protein
VLRPSVLLAEDFLDVQAYFVDILENEAGCSVTAVTTADGALSLLQGGARFDLLFTDVRMPGELNGFELAREARRADAAMKIVCMTGYADLQPAPGTCDVFLQKPIKPKKLIALVNELLTPR